MTSRQIRAFLQEPACLVIIEAARRQGRSPLHELDLLITDRFGVLTHGMRRAFGKELRVVVEAVGGRHVRTGVRATVKPQVTAPSIYA
ncbi:hypothetical protein GA0061099_1004448 [Bradyrhizobium yuanmingense]|uniref:Uncharacterized protein n=1 Tax=Bradyrhizobium yuanmingense TaxID=108015 RepID=A0A1C3VS42_9BRAD|nr:hypothetical protein [Bradyrhizobium yuanmingense]TWI28860.1 hypothetical protein IQ15_02207 [Bradyrhizobium yuanmingense]SCB30324.1 hypothetical protein GA0061099_1004448 [Bradyrhizobium yuanmingense]